jgi:hypothetical protein
MTGLTNWFYYLAPLWFLVEVFFWPDFRAGLVTGPGVLGAALFYAAEGSLGVAIRLKVPFAGAAALAENVIYLILAMKFMVLTPLSVADMMLDSPEVAETLARSYSASLPGMIFSMAYVGSRLSGVLRNAGADRSVSPGPQ